MRGPGPRVAWAGVVVKLNDGTTHAAGFRKITELYERGLSQLEISNALGISQGYVSQLVTKYNIVKGKREESG